MPDIVIDKVFIKEKYGVDEFGALVNIIFENGLRAGKMLHHPVPENVGSAVEMAFDALFNMQCDTRDHEQMDIYYEAHKAWTDWVYMLEVKATEG